jgi:hypothetical protein
VFQGATPTQVIELASDNRKGRVKPPSLNAFVLLRSVGAPHERRGWLARCYVSFEYDEGSCPMYEEFVFSGQAEMTFIDPWSDQPGLLPTSDPSDRGAGLLRPRVRLA